jgi:hypothetical protein
LSNWFLCIGSWREICSADLWQGINGNEVFFWAGVFRLIDWTGRRMKRGYLNRGGRLKGPETLGEVERVEGIEPSTKAWEAFVLPLNYTRF